MRKQRLSKLRAAILGVVAVLVAGFVVLPNTANAGVPDVPYVPTVVAPAHGVETVDTKPLITGVTQNDTEVAVYIDGAFNGKATVVNDASGTANWYYYPFLDLTTGWHTLQARAENPVSGLRSEASDLTKFEVVDPNAPVDAVAPYVPTLVLPVHGLVTEELRPVVTGVVQNDMLVTVYVDGVYHGNATVTNDESGIGSFAYVPVRDLEAGWHKIKVRAEDPDTALYSGWSEEHKIKVLAPTPAPTLLTPVVNGDTTWEKPWVIGYTHAGTEVAVYIDGEFNGFATIEVIEGKEVLHFTYLPYLDLSAGWHKVWVTAKDASGKVSEQSATTWFTVTDPDAPVVVIEDDATEEEGDDIGGPVDEEGETSEEGTEEGEEDVYVEGESEDTEEGTEGEDTEEVDEEEGDEEVADGEEGDEEVTDGEEEVDGEKKTSRSTLIGWIILAAVAIALVWRGRKGMKSFFNEPELGGVDTIKPKKDDKPADKPKKDDKPADKPKSDKGDKGKDGKKDSKKTPPPPPPASSF